MTEVCQGNVYLTVEEDEIDKYLAKGFSVVDPQTGKIIKQSIPTEIGPLKKMYSEQVELNRKLTSEIALLRNELQSSKEMKTAESTAASSSEDSSWDNWTEDNTSKQRKSSKGGKR